MWFIGLDSMVAVEDFDHTLTEEEAISQAYTKILHMLEESRDNVSGLLDWNVEYEGY